MKNQAVGANRCGCSEPSPQSGRGLEFGREAGSVFVVNGFADRCSHGGRMSAVFTTTIPMNIRRMEWCVGIAAVVHIQNKIVFHE
jgi:hypothetical protein